MSIQIDQLPLGMLQTNCYLVGDTESKQAVVIDPSDEHEAILAQIDLRGYTVREIIATHAHFDHVLASYPLKEALGVPFRLHPNEVPLLQKSVEMATIFGIRAAYPPAEQDGFIQHGEVIQVGAIRLTARFTPGHSPGHLMFCMADEQVVFVGDCIFYDGFGRTDLPFADAATLKHSIQTEILTLPEDYILLSGHGPQTTVGREKRASAALAYLLQMPM